MSSSNCLPDNTATILQFLSVLFAQPGQQDGFLTLTAIHPQRDDLRRPSRHIPLGSPTLANHIAQLLAANRLGWGAHFAIAPRRADLGSYARGGLNDVLYLPMLFTDIDRPYHDALTALELLPPPTALVHSGHGLHAYWKLAEPINDPHSANALLAALTRAVAGDHAINITTSARLPETVNTKADRMTPCRLMLLEPTRFYPPRDFPQPDNLASSSDYRAADSPILDAIQHELSTRWAAVPKFPGSPWYKALCPFLHQHDAVGSHFYWDSRSGAGNCFGKHGPISPQQLCDILNIHRTDRHADAPLTRRSPPLARRREHP